MATARLPRDLHPVAWWVWAIGLAAAASFTTNPFVLLLIVGAATVVVDRQHLKMRPGDCLPIPLGAMHDMPDAPTPVKAVYFETTLRGRKRTGHLWQHAHGPAVREEASL